VKIIDSYIELLQKSYSDPNCYVFDATFYRSLANLKKINPDFLWLKLEAKGINL
jgi:hypothetical protein